MGLDRRTRLKSEQYNSNITKRGIVNVPKEEVVAPVLVDQFESFRNDFNIVYIYSGTPRS